MNNRGFYIAAALLLAAIGLFYFFDVRKPAPAATASPQPSPIVSIDPNSVTEIDVKSGGQVLAVTRSGSNWRYSVCAADTAGCPTSPADASRSVQLLIAILQLRPAHTIFGAPDGLPAYGLATAASEIDVKSPSRSISLLVGAVAPDTTNIYVRLADSNDIQAVAASTVQSQIIGVIASPPVPVPSPSPGASTGSSPTPSAPAAGPRRAISLRLNRVFDWWRKADDAGRLPAGRVGLLGPSIRCFGVLTPEPLGN